MSEEGASRRLPLPVPKLVLPKYELEDVFALFIQFLSEHGCSCTRSVLEKELQVLQITPSTTEGLEKLELEQHYSYCLAQLVTRGCAEVLPSAHNDEPTHTNSGKPVAAGPGSQNTAPLTGNAAAPQLPPPPPLPPAPLPPKATSQADSASAVAAAPGSCQELQEDAAAPPLTCSTREAAPLVGAGTTTPATSSAPAAAEEDLPAQPDSATNAKAELGTVLDIIEEDHDHDMLMMTSTELDTDREAAGCLHEVSGPLKCSHHDVMAAYNGPADQSHGNWGAGQHQRGTSAGSHENLDMDAADARLQDPTTSSKPAGSDVAHCGRAEDATRDRGRLDGGYRNGGRPEDGYRNNARDGSYRNSSRPEDSYRNGGRPDDAYKGSSRPDNGYRSSGRPDNGYKGSGRPDDGFRSGGRPDNGCKGSGRPDDGYRSSGRPDDGYRGGGRVCKDQRMGGRAEDAQQRGTTPDTGSRGNSRQQEGGRPRDSSWQQHKRQRSDGEGAHQASDIHNQRNSNYRMEQSDRPDRAGRAEWLDQADRPGKPGQSGRTEVPRGDGRAPLLLSGNQRDSRAPRAPAGARGAGAQDGSRKQSTEGYDHNEHRSYRLQEQRHQEEQQLPADDGHRGPNDEQQQDGIQEHSPQSEQHQVPGRKRPASEMDMGSDPVTQPASHDPTNLDHRNDASPVQSPQRVKMVSSNDTPDHLAQTTKERDSNPRSQGQGRQQQQLQKAAGQDHHSKGQGHRDGLGSIGRDNERDRRRDCTRNGPWKRDWQHSRDVDQPDDRRGEWHSNQATELPARSPSGRPQSRDRGRPDSYERSRQQEPRPPSSGRPIQGRSSSASPSRLRSQQADGPGATAPGKGRDVWDSARDEARDKHNSVRHGKPPSSDGQEQKPRSPRPSPSGNDPADGPSKRSALISWEDFNSEKDKGQLEDTSRGRESDVRRQQDRGLDGRAAPGAGVGQSSGRGRTADLDRAERGKGREADPGRPLEAGSYRGRGSDTGSGRGRSTDGSRGGMADGLRDRLHEGKGHGDGRAGAGPRASPGGGHGDGGGAGRSCRDADRGRANLGYVPQ